MTRFYIELMAKDGSNNRTLTTDTDELIIPELGSDLMIWDGFSTTIMIVSIAPTMDPMVYVRGKTIFTESKEETDDIIDQAVSKEGWRVI